jgi:hypothetical protein
MNITLENKTYTIEPAKVVDLVQDQEYLLFDKRGKDLTYDIIICKVIKAKQTSDIELILGSLDLYDYILTKEQVIELGIDKLQKYSFYAENDPRNNTENHQKFFKILVVKEN